MRQIAKSELRRILQQHQLWLTSGCREGAHADLREADLQYVYLQEVDLRGADLQGADLQGVDLQYADLRGAQLDVNVRNCWSFLGAKFTADALPWLILHPQWADWKDSVRIVEAAE